jgi:hypothetical protein
MPSGMRCGVDAVVKRIVAAAARARQPKSPRDA